MARERISLVPEEEKEVKQIKSMIESGEINTDNFHELPLELQKEVSRILFEMAESQINLAHGVSALEFVTFAFIRLMQKQVKGLPLSAEDKIIEEKLNRILDLHQITNKETYMDDWLFDYLEYAEAISKDVLKNRKDHIERKKKVIGRV